MMLKRIFILIATGLSLIGCMLLNLIATSPDLTPLDMTGTAIELNATVAAENNYSTEDIYHLTATRIIFEATSGTLAVQMTEWAMTAGVRDTATAAYWETQGVTPTPDEFTIWETQIAEDTTTTFEAAQTFAVVSATPDNFALTATELMFELRSGTYEAEATSGTVEARLTSTMMAWQAMITATANYWATQGVTPTFHPGYLTQVAPYITQTQAAETAIANDCDIVEHHYQRYLFYYHIRDNVEIDERTDFPYNVFDCPDRDDQPYVPIDLYIDVIIPNDAYNEEVYEILDQALVLILDYPPENTTLGTENVSVSVFRLNRYLASQPLLRMEFAFSALESALEEGLEGEALLEALGGIETVTP